PVRRAATRHGVLLIADEVVAGFGRTGELFGSRTWKVKPDLMVFAKGINSGYVPLGATMINGRIEQAFRGHEKAGFMHGNTYLAHPLACAAALVNIDIVVGENLSANARTVGDYFMAELKKLAAGSPHIGDVRGKGLMIGVELVRNKATKGAFPRRGNVGAQGGPPLPRQRHPHPQRLRHLHHLAAADAEEAACRPHHPRDGGGAGSDREDRVRRRQAAAPWLGRSAST